MTGLAFAVTAQKVDMQDDCWCKIVPAAEREGKLVVHIWYYRDYFEEAVSDFQRKYDIKLDLRIYDQEELFN